jgi:O-antigen biosynthesis protein
VEENSKRQDQPQEAPAAEIEALKRQLAEQERWLDQVHSDYTRLRLDYAALADSAAQLRPQLEQAEQERTYLQQALTRFEHDLRALQSTRTVQATRLAGQLVQRLKGKISRQVSGDRYQVSGIRYQVSGISDQPSALNTETSAISTQPSELNDSALSTQHSALLYQHWIAENEPDEAALSDQRKIAAQLAYRPLISIIMPVYNPPLAVLQAAIQSVQAQTYDNWELCLADASNQDSGLRNWITALAEQDKRVRVQFLGQNGGIVANSNAALALAQGEFCAFLDHDDTLSSDALFEVAQALNTDQTLDFLYSDYDLLDGEDSHRFQPLFKPDWSPEIMLSANYLTHLTVIRTALIREVGNFAPDTDGAQDWDLFWRILEKTDHVQHLPKILYHWRMSASSTAGDIYRKPEAPTAQLRAIEAHLKRIGLDGQAFFDTTGFIRVKWPLPGTPKVSIIIPTKDKLELLRPCVQSILEKTAYPHYEVILVDTGSTDPAVAAYYRELADESRLKILHYAQPFNFSAVNNWAAHQCDGELLLFLNNDTEVIAPDWLEEMVRWGQRPEIGPVGAKLLKPDGSIQHAGVVVGLGGYAGHIFAGMPEGSDTIFGYTEWYRDYSAVTAACMLLRRSVFEELGGFEEAFKLNGSDVDLCLRARARGYRVVFNPFARLYHLESATHQGHVPFSDYRLSQERYRPLLESGDPYFNPNLSYHHANPELKDEGGEKDEGGRMKAEGSKSAISRQPSAVSPETSASSTQPSAPPVPSSSFILHPSSFNYESWFWERYSLDAQHNAQVWDFSRANLERSRELHHLNPGLLELKTLTWFLPTFQHAFYGGIHTILRFAAYFQEAKGVSNRFVIVRPQAITPQAIAQAIATAFPTLQNAPVEAVESYADLAKLAATDGAIATYWTTAYYLLRFNATKRKFYFIQDYEPLFYPAGTSYALAEAPYRFGFYGLTNTVSLRDIYCQQYGGQATFFTPAVNTALFKPQVTGDRYQVSGKVAQGIDEVQTLTSKEGTHEGLNLSATKEGYKLATQPSALSPHPSSLFFYARPGAPRNAFELGTTALRKLKSRLGERVRIVSAGANWQPAQYGLEGVVENLGLLGYEQTAELYRTCDVGLVMMFTRHPSYLPFELMASGCLVVTNENSATRWMLKDRENCLLTAPSATSLAETLELGLTDQALRQRLTARALADIRTNYADWEAQMEQVFGFMQNPTSERE